MQRTAKKAKKKTPAQLARERAERVQRARERDALAGVLDTAAQARLLGIARQTQWKLERSGKLKLPPKRVLGGRSVRLRSEMEAFLANLPKVEAA